MSNSTGRTSMLLAGAGAMIGVPVLLGSMWTSWQLVVEARQEHVVQRPDVAAAAEQITEVASLPPVPELVLPLVTERTMADVVEGLMEVETETLNVDDLDPALPYRLAAQLQDGLVIGATVDLGRDGTIDEWWTLRPTLGREVMKDGARQRLVKRDGAWVPE
jgi:hypothetical protein